MLLTKNQRVAISVAFIGAVGVVIAVVKLPKGEHASVEYTGIVTDTKSRPLLKTKVTMFTQGPPAISYTDQNGVYHIKLDHVTRSAEVKIKFELDGFEPYSQNLSDPSNTRIEDIHLTPIQGSEDLGCSDSYLVVHAQDRRGTMNMYEGAGGAYDRRFRFSVTNVSSRCRAIVTNTFIEVLEAIQNPTGPREGVVVPYGFIVKVGPKDAGKLLPVTKNDFEYAPHESHEYLVDIRPKKWGYTYALRLAIRWYDVLSNHRESRSWVVLAPFPKNHDPAIPHDGLSAQESAFWWGRGGTTFINKEQKLLIKLRQKYDQTEESVNDASTKDAPIKIGYHARPTGQQVAPQSP